VSGVAGGPAVRDRGVAGGVSAARQTGTQDAAAFSGGRASGGLTQSGLLGRKGDGEPGARTIWDGLEQIAVCVRSMKFAAARLSPGGLV